MAWLANVLDFFTPDSAKLKIESPPDKSNGLHEKVHELIKDELQEDDTSLEYEEVTVPVNFIWGHGGTSVFLTTSLDGWERPHRMSESHGLYMKVLNLPAGRQVLYRFLVDGCLVCDHEKKHVKNPDDRGNANEIIAVTEEQQRTGSGRLMNSASGMYSWSDSKFGQTLPKQNSYFGAPPAAPPHLGAIPLNHIPESKFEDPRLLPVQSHVTVGHVYVAKRIENEMVVLGMTQRFRDKMYTTVYYKHEDSLESIKRSRSQEAKLHTMGDTNSFVLKSYFRRGSYGHLQQPEDLQPKLNVELQSEASA